MPSIDVCKSHSKPMPQARQAVQRVADHISERFAVACEWRGDSLHFERTGVHGQIDLSPSEVRVVAQLGFLMGALKGPIEAEVHRYLEQEFS